jgi:hypothetical protein
MIWISMALLNLKRRRLRMVARELITPLGFKLNDADAKKYDKQIDSTKRKQAPLFSSMLKAQTIYGVASRVIGAAFNTSSMGTCIRRDARQTNPCYSSKEWQAIQAKN